MESPERTTTQRNGRTRKVLLALALWAVLGLTIHFTIGALAAESAALNAGQHSSQGSDEIGATGALPLPGPSPSPRPQYINTGEISGPVNPDLAFEGPTWVTTDSEGAIYVVDVIRDHVQKYAANGVLTDVSGAPDDPPIDGPIATGPDDEIYIANWLSDQIEVYDRDGALLRSWTMPDCNGSGGAAGGIAVGTYGYVYVTDTSNHRVLQFTDTGTLLQEWGLPGCQPGSGDWEFEYPTEIAVDYAGRVYVHDNFNDRIQVFEAAGVWVDTWYDTSGRFDNIVALAGSPSGLLYAASVGTPACPHCVLEIDGNGTILNEWGRSGSDPDAFLLPQDIAVGPSGDLVIVDPTNDRVQRFTTGGELLDLWSDAHRGRLSELSYGMALDGDGNVYLAESSYGRIQVLGSDSAFRYEFGEQGGGIGQIAEPVDLALSPDGYIYVVDRATNRVVKYKLNGTYVTEWGSGSLIEPWGIAVDADGSVYVANNSKQGLIQKFDGAGVLRAAWGTPGQGEGEFDFPVGIAVHGGRVYVTDNLNHRVQIFDRHGRYITMFGSAGSGEGQFANPAGIAVGANGYVFVADTLNHRVQVFTADGRYLTEVTTRVENSQESLIPWQIEVTPDGAVYSLDLANLKVEIFEQPTIPR